MNEGVKDYSGSLNILYFWYIYTQVKDKIGKHANSSLKKIRSRCLSAIMGFDDILYK